MLLLEGLVFGLNDVMRLLGGGEQSLEGVAFVIVVIFVVVLTSSTDILCHRGRQCFLPLGGGIRFQGCDTV